MKVKKDMLLEYLQEHCGKDIFTEEALKRIVDWGVENLDEKSFPQYIANMAGKDSDVAPEKIKTFISQKYFLVATDGFSIEYTAYWDIDEARQAMAKAYNYYVKPDDEWIAEYAEASHLGTDEAILYDNGMDVFVWQIIKA